MSANFGFSRSGRGGDDHWFRVGRLDVTTTLLVVILSVISLVVFAVEPLGKPVQFALADESSHVVHGQVWRLLTWPVSNPVVSLWTAVDIFFFWYFGVEIESRIGRSRMAWFVGGMTAVLGILWVVLCLVLPYGSYYLSGLNILGLMVLLAFIAEYPNRRFFFNIPGWVIGVVLVGIQVIQLLGYRSYLGLLHLLIGIALCAVVARSVGLLEELAWIPRPTFHRRASKPRRNRAAGRPSGPTVVAGPWQPPAQPVVSRDQAALDALLDKISAGGMDSLTDAERDQLLVLRDRLRRR